MPERRDPPPTDEGWFALHDFRRIDWDAWRDAPERERRLAVEEGVTYLQDHADLVDADEGATAVYSIAGHKADLLVLHLRPTLAAVETAERRFEGTAFARYTDQPTSFVSVTEASGYSERARDYFTGDLDPNSGLARYIRSRLYPQVPDAAHVCFYPMDKRRAPEQNWYDLPFDERAEHMDAHGVIGRDYGGQVTQMITGAIGLDDWEWGVTLWADDMTDVKDLLYEMRFDPSTSQFAEFGPFYVGQRIAPDDLDALLAGEPVGSGAPASDEAADDAPAAASAGQGASHPAGAGSEAGGDHGGEHGAGHAGATGAESHPDEGHADAAHAEGAHPTDDEGDGGEDEEGEAEAAGGGGGGDGSGGGSGGGGGGGGGRPDVSDVDIETVDDLPHRLVELGLHPGEDYDRGDYGLVFYSDADAQPLADEVAELEASFDHYDRHVSTQVKASGGRAAAVSLWTAEDAAETAAGFLNDLPGITERLGGQLAGDGVDWAADGDAADKDEDVAADEDEDVAADEDADAAAGGPVGDEDAAEAVREELAAEGIYAGQPHGEDVYALVCYSTADPEDLQEEVETLRGGFDRYDTHEGTDVYEQVDGDALAVASLWATEDAAETASDYLADLPEITGWAEEGDGFSTMGMFYSVKPAFQSEFVETFAEVGDLLAAMEGHRETALLANREDETEMFIASQWDSKEDAMTFFRSEEFAETVSWGRDVLEGTPRHVFLA